MAAVSTIKLGNKYYVYEEVNHLAEQLGMDFEQDKELYLDFIKGALNTLLPVGWKRERNPTGKILYHNIQTSHTTDTHPLIYHFRKAFLELIQNNDKEPAPTPKYKASPRTQEPELDSLPKVSKVKLWNFETELKIHDTLVSKLQDSPVKSDNSGIDQALDEATQFYKKLLEDSISKPPEAIENTLEYQLIDPQKMLQKFKEMNLPPRPELVWIARLSLMLPLPPLWKYSFDALGNKIYENIKLNVCTRLHPSSNFLTELIKNARFSREKTEVSNRMIFHDKEYKRYEVDLNLLLAGSSSVVFYNNQPSPRYYKEATKAKPKLDVIEMLSDVMVLQIAADCGVDLDKELHLVGLVFDFVENLKKHDLFKGWEFRYTTQMEIYWYNEQLRRSSKVFPFRESLANHIKQARMQSLKRSKARIKIIYERHPDFKTCSKEFIDKTRKESLNLLRNKVRKEMEEDYLDKINLSEYLIQSSKYPIKKSELYDLLFTCPFAFDKLEDKKSYGIYKIKPKEYLEESKKTGLKKRSRRRKLEIESDISFGTVSSGSLYQDRSIEIESDQEEAEEGKPVVRNMKPLHTAIRNVRRNNTKSRYMNQDLYKNSPTARIKGVGSPKFRSHRRNKNRTLTVVDKSSESGSGGEVSDTSFQSDLPKLVLNEAMLKLINSRMKKPRRGLKKSNYDSNDPLNIHTYGDSRGDSSFSSRRDHIFSSVPSSKVGRSENRHRFISAAPLTHSRSQSRLPFKHFPEFTNEGSSATERNINLGTNGMRGTKKVMIRKDSSHSDISRPSVISASNAKESPLDYAIKVRAYEQRSSTEFDIEPIKPIYDKNSLTLVGTHLNSPASNEEEDKPRQPAIHYKSQSMINTDFKSIVTIHKKNESLPKLPFNPQAFKPEVPPELLNSWKVEEESDNISKELYISGSDAPRKIESKNSILRGENEVIRKAKHQRTVSRSSADVPNSAENMVRVAKKNSKIVKMQLQRKKRDVSSSQQLLPTIDRQNLRYATPTKNLSSQEYTVMNSLKPSLHNIPYTSAYSFGRYEELLKDRQERMYFMYYMSKLGHPYDRRFKYLNYILESFILPSHIIYMAKRMNLKVSAKKYESVESDILWIPYLQLAVPPPANSHIPKKVIDLVEMDLGTHPGDLYFHLLVSFHKAERMKELRELSDIEKARSMKESSWLPFKDLKGKLYYYNFMSGKQTYRKPFGILLREKSPIKSIESVKKVLTKTQIGTITQDREFKKDLSKLSTLRIVAPRSVSMMKNMSASGLKL